MLLSAYAVLKVRIVCFSLKAEITKLFLSFYAGSRASIFLKSSQLLICISLILPLRNFSASKLLLEATHKHIDIDIAYLKIGNITSTSFRKQRY